MTGDMRKEPDLRDPVQWLAFGFGSGLAPPAPGTIGTALALFLYWLAPPFSPLTHALLLAPLAGAGIWLCGSASRTLGVHDHGGIVWDEVAGMYVTLLVAPPTILGWALAFLAFRLFDIVKPWPIRDLDHRMKGGLGIMLDDIAAALYAMILLALYGWLMN